ncbi:MAG: hypothetical protein LBI26_02675 [Holosporales bacterium]|jgi:hypothetical protein|nr:hypothetical protein [Holosporales bacterium]
MNCHKDGSAYSPTDFAVKINLDLYNPIEVNKKQYYALDGDKVVLKPKTLAGSIFHEFVHGLHHVSKTPKNNKVCIPNTLPEYIWQNDEELRTITGYINESFYDPICDHVFDYSLYGESFQPRYGHLGYDNLKSLHDAEQRQKLLLYAPESQKIMDNWKRYMK